MLRLGVVVLNWNGREHLAPCLDSLRHSDHPDAFVVVVDNGSTDGSVDWVRQAHPEVEVLSLGENRRFAGGNNAGAELAIERGAQNLLLLNNDTTVAPSTLRRLSEPLEDPAGPAVTGPRIVYADAVDMIWYGGGHFDPWTGYVAHRALRRRVDAGADPGGPTDWVTGCALATRARVYRELGGLDEDYYIYAEDVDYCLRARARGWKVEYVPAAVVRHAVSATVGGAASAFKVYHRVRSRRLLLRRHGRGPLRGLWPAVEDLARAAALITQGHGDAVRALWRAHRDRPDTPPTFTPDDLLRAVRREPEDA